jgi:hypothetical protein
MSSERFQHQNIGVRRRVQFLGASPSATLTLSLCEDNEELIGEPGGAITLSF